MKFIYGCQRVGKDPETRKAYHLPPVLVVEGDHAESGNIVSIDGPSEIVTQLDDRPPEIERCKDHSHSIWIQTDASVVCQSGVAPQVTPRTRRIYVCATVGRSAPGTYLQGAIVYDSDAGQSTARHLKLLGPSRVIFDEHNPLIGYCPCKMAHPHRMWIETEHEIELVE